MIGPAASPRPPLALGSPAEQGLVWVSWLVGYLIFGAVLLRTVLVYAGTPELVPSGLLLGLYLGLYGSFDLIAHRAAWYPPVCLVLQVGVVAALLWLPSFPDFVAALFIAISAQAVQHFTPRQVAGWIGLFAVVLLYFLISRWGLASGLITTAVYLAICGFVVAYGLASQRALVSRARNQALWLELKTATQQLQTYAAQQEQLAAARERSRLARDLHDSVTQTIFSLTLTAQSALLLADRDPARVEAQLDRLEELAHSALGELRSLVTQLRPASTANDGLLAALQQHLVSRQLQDGLAVTFEVEAPGSLLPAEEASLFRIVQEALNNVVKHAHTSRARVRLSLSEPAWVEVSDGGQGFVTGQAPGAGHLGLANMRARAEEIGWRLIVTSSPGLGTCVRAEKPRSEGQP